MADWVVWSWESSRSRIDIEIQVKTKGSVALVGWCRRSLTEIIHSAWNVSFCSSVCKNLDVHHAMKFRCDPSNILSIVASEHSRPCRSAESVSLYAQSHIWRLGLSRADTAEIALLVQGSWWHRVFVNGFAHCSQRNNSDCPFKTCYGRFCQFHGEKITFMFGMKKNSRVECTKSAISEVSARPSPRRQI